MPSAPIDTTATVDVVAAHATATAFIRVHAVHLTADGVSLSRLQDGSSNTLTGLASSSGGNVLSQGFCEQGYFDLPAGSKLQLVVGAGTARLLGHVVYSYRNVPLGA